MNPGISILIRTFNSAAILKLLRNPSERMRLGGLARQQVLSEYNNDKIGALLEKSYTLAIQRHSAKKSA